MKRFFNLPLLILIITVLFFFKPFFFENKLPIPADTIIGLYHPFRDLYAKEYPNGIPYKNFLITDPVRQQYPWRMLSLEQGKRGELALWNPYSMAGTPLAATLQGAVFYPLNIVLFIVPFSIGWSMLILLQPLLAGIFLFYYLRNLKLHPIASLLGAVVFAFCGFSIAWLEWGTLVHIVLWLPLLLLAIDKLFARKKTVLWSVIFVLALSFSLLAGHFQFFFYVFCVTLLYFLARWLQTGKSIKMLGIFAILLGCFLILTFIQWWPTLQFIAQSGRDVDQLDWHKAGWFIPWQHLVQFIAPDFFGNPATLNYWGVWNYGELVGYIGLAPLVMSIFALFYRRDKKTFFFGFLFFLALIFSLPTFFAQLPFTLQVPFLSTSQPTRLLLVIDFSLAILAALGLDYFIKQKNKKQILSPLILIGIVLGGLWLFVMQNSGENMLTAKRNLYVPTALTVIISFLILIQLFIKNKKVQSFVLILFILVTLFDLLRFGQKFTPVTDSRYLFPSTKTLAFLQQDKSQFRVMTTDSRILPPNFSVMYHIQSIDGYDPLFLRRYGELIAASERGRPDITPPFGFNRIITPQNSNSKIIDLLGVKYVLSFSDLPAEKFTKVFEEGQTKIYQNKQAFPRAFFVEKVITADSKQKALNYIFATETDLQTTAIVEDAAVRSSSYTVGKISDITYGDNAVIITTQNQREGFLILTDSFYPTWNAKICSKDGSNCRKQAIYRTDYHFRGVVVPSGEHSILFYNTLL